VYNHSDAGAGHVNYFDVPVSEIRGSQPVPARLMLKTGSDPVRRLGKIIISGGVNLWDGAGSFDHVLEGESAAVGPGCTSAVTVADSGASGGSFQTLQWTSVEEIHLCSWTLSGERLAWLAGRGLRPAARLHSPPPPEPAGAGKSLNPARTRPWINRRQTLWTRRPRQAFRRCSAGSVAVRALPNFTLEAWLNASA